MAWKALALLQNKDRHLWHTHSDLYGIRTPTFILYELIFLGMGGVVFRSILISGMHFSTTEHAASSEAAVPALASILSLTADQQQEQRKLRSACQCYDMQIGTSAEPLSMPQKNISTEDNNKSKVLIYEQHLIRWHYQRFGPTNSCPVSKPVPSWPKLLENSFLEHFLM